MQPRTAGGPAVRVGRVYVPRADDPWARVLVDRLWPRGLTKARADLDCWCKDIAPSTELRRWYHENDQYLDFRERYHEELDALPQRTVLGRLVELALSQGVVLLTSTRNVDTSHAAVICDLMNEMGGAGG